MMIIPENQNTQNNYEDFNHVFKKLKIDKKPQFMLSNTKIKGLSSKFNYSNTQKEEELKRTFPYILDSEAKKVLSSVEYNLEEAKNYILDNSTSKTSKIDNSNSTNNFWNTKLSTITSRNDDKQSLLSSKRLFTDNEKIKTKIDSNPTNSNIDTSQSLKEKIKLASIKLSGCKKKEFSEEFKKLISPLLNSKIILNI